MAEQRSRDSFYPSRYSPDAWVTPAQYIIEFVCEQKARHEGKDLPLRFWELKKWRQFFVSQTRPANKLLKKYTPRAIINAIKNNRIRSLYPKWVLSAVAKEERTLDLERKSIIKQAVQEVETSTGLPKSREKTFASGALNKLLALDEEIDDE